MGELLIGNLRPLGHDDDRRNDMALYRLCHWTFDEGLLAVSIKYVVQASPRLQAEPNVLAHLAALHERTMLTPTEIDY